MDEKVIKEKDDDEIYFYEIILILKKRIKLIVGIVLASVVIATVLVFLMPNIYRARATVWVDSFLTPALVQSLESLQSATSNKIFFILPVQPNHDEINNLAISILNSFEMKTKIAETLKNSYGKEENFNLGAKIDKKTQSIMITADNKDKKLAETIVMTAVDELDKELKKVSENYSKILAKNPDNVKNANFFVLNVIEKPFVLDSPVKPKRKLIIAVSAVTSLFIGVFLAFVLEWWNKMRQIEKR